MSERTIPAPHQDQIAAARSGIRFRAEENGVDISSPDAEKFVNEVAGNIAQLNAEIFWLRSMLHLANIPE